MAKTVDQYIIQVKTKGTKKADDKVGNISKSLKKMKSSAFSAAKGGIAVLGTALVAATAYSVKTAIEFEKLKTRLNTLYGSVNAGTQAFNTFNQVASTTPFALKDVVEAGASLKAFGMDAEENVKGLADLAAFMGVDIVEAAGAMGRAFAGGAGAADVFRDRGVLNIIKMREGVDDLSKVSLPEFRRMMKEAIEDPTVGIAGATDALAETFSGRYSNMMDSVDKLANSIGEKLLPMAEKVVTWLGASADAAYGAENAFDTQMRAVRSGQVQLKILKENLEKTEKGTDAWKIQLMKIRQEYPEFLAGIKDENITLGLLNDKYANYNDLSEKRIQILEKEKKKEALLERQTDLIKEQTTASTAFGAALEEVDDNLQEVFLKARDKANLNTEAGQEFVSNLAEIKRELTDQENLYLSGKITTAEFYDATIKAQQDFTAELEGSKTFGAFFNDTLKQSGTLISDSVFQQAAINSYISDILDDSEEIVELNKENEGTLKRLNVQYTATGAIIKNIDDDLKTMNEGDQEGLIPSPDPKLLKEYEKAAEDIQKTIEKYQTGSLALSSNYANAELSILKSKNTKTIADLESIAFKEQKILETKQSKEMTSLEAQQRAIREKKALDFQFAMDNNLLDADQQQAHHDNMKQLEIDFQTDISTLKETHTLQGQDLDNQSDQAILDQKKEYYDERLAQEQAFQEKKAEVEQNMLDAQMAVEDMSHQIYMNGLSQKAAAAQSAEVQTFASVDRITEFQIQNERTRLASLQGNLEAVQAAELAASEAQRDQKLLDAEADYNTLLETYMRDGDLNKHEHAALKREKFSQDLEKELIEEGHQINLTEIKKRHAGDAAKIADQSEDQQIAIANAAAMAKMKIAVGAAQGLMSAFKDNATALFNMNKKDKKNMLHLEKAVAAASGIAEIVGIWKAAPSGLAGVPIKTVLTLSAALRTAGNIAKIDDQIGQLDSVTDDVGSSGGGSNYTFTKQQAATGFDGIIDSPTNLLVGEAGAEQVNVTPMDGRSTNGTGTTVNISGNVMSQDFADNELPDLIKEAIRRGADFGIDDHRHATGMGRTSEGFRE